MTRRAFSLGTAFLLGGCMTLATPRHAHQSQQVSDTPALAYAKTIRAVLAMGGQIVSTDAHTRTVSARLNKAVSLGVTLAPWESGTLLSVHATADVGFLLSHDVPEDVQAFLTAYAKE